MKKFDHFKFNIKMYNIWENKLLDKFWRENE